MSHSQSDKAALGRRLASARKLAGYTIEGAAKALTQLGYPITKAAVGYWETGKNLPDALWLRRLAKLYGTTLDALVWDDSLTIESIRFAAQYDGLDERQKRRSRRCGSPISSSPPRTPKWNGTCHPPPSISARASRTRGHRPPLPARRAGFFTAVDTARCARQEAGPNGLGFSPATVRRIPSTNR